MSKLLRFKELKGKGVPWVRQHVRRKIEAGEFPPPVRLGENSIAWLEEDIDRWLAERIEQSKPPRAAVERDAAPAAGDDDARPAV